MATYITCTRVANICIAAAVLSAAIGRETQRINGWADGGAEVGVGVGESGEADGRGGGLATEDLKGGEKVFKVFFFFLNFPLLGREGGSGGGWVGLRGRRAWAGLEVFHTAL